MKKNISLILACTFEGGIGVNNNIPWKISSDLKKFKNITSTTNHSELNNAIIMGSNTYKSLPVSYLPNRINIVISKTKEIEKYNKNIRVFSDINEAIIYCNYNNLIESIFIIGGAQIYNHFLTNYKHIDNIYLSLIREKYFCDTHIDMNIIFQRFYFIKDTNYTQDNDKYISYICKRKNYNKT